MPRIRKPAQPPASAGARHAPSRRRRLLIGAAAIALTLGAGGVALALTDGGVGPGSDRPVSGSLTRGSLGGVQDTEEAQAFPEPASADSHPEAEDPTQLTAAALEDSGPSPGAPSDAEIRRDLRQLERYQRGARSGGSIAVSSDGEAKAPLGAPGAIADAVAAGNAIATFPYRLGGGHGSFVDSAYDCSGSVSYALAAAGMLAAPLTSGELMRWGRPGPGRWLTVYANPGHVYMTVGGLRFDTSGRSGRRGSRWQGAQRSPRGFVARHWPGL